MNAQQFADFQEAFILVYGPIILWLAALMAALGIFSAVAMIVGALLAQLTKTR
jgi:hypothetical protein